MEKLKVVFAERGIYPYLERIALKGNTFNDGCKTVNWFKLKSLPRKFWKRKGSAFSRRKEIIRIQH